MFRQRSAQVYLTIFCFLIGLGVIMQLRTQSRTVKDTQAQSSVEQAQVLSNLVDSNADLNREIRSLEDQLASFKQTSGQSELDTIVAELNRMKIINGRIEVSGQGVEIWIDRRITVLDMQDLINELRNAGAEAIGVNGQRIIMASVVKEDKEGLIIDDIRISPPYILTAIGNSDTLERAVERKGGVTQILRYNHPEAVISVSKETHLVIPIYQGTFGMNYATVAK
jgi:uncharacterized protein YlxW (UPF0749 family)